MAVAVVGRYGVAGGRQSLGLTFGSESGAASRRHAWICAPCAFQDGTHETPDFSRQLLGLRPLPGRVQQIQLGQLGTGVRNYSGLRHTWNLSPPCVRVTAARLTCPDPVPVFLSCSPLSPVSVSPVCMSPCLAPTSRSHN